MQEIVRMPTVSSEAQRIRHALGLSQEDMAYRMGFTRQHYNELENDRKPWSKRAIQALRMLAAEIEGDDVRSDILPNSPLSKSSAISSQNRLKHHLSNEHQRRKIGVLLKDMILDPEFRSSSHSDGAREKLEDVMVYLQPWLEAGFKDPNVAAYLLSQLKIHLPANHLEALSSEIEAEET